MRSIQENTNLKHAEHEDQNEQGYSQIQSILKLFCIIVIFLGNMTAMYTEHAIRALNKTQLIRLFLKL